MRSKYLVAVGCRVFATVSALVAGVASLRLYSLYLSPETYGGVLVALQIINYLPLLDGGFRTVVNRRLLAQPNPDEKMKLVRFSQIFYSYLAILLVGVSLAGMLGYAYTPNALQSSLPLSFFLMLGLVGAVTVFGSIQNGLLVGLQSQASLFVLTGLNSWLMIGTVWLALRMHLGVWAFPLASLAGFLGTFPLGMLLIKARMPGVRFFLFQADADYWHHFHQLKSDAWAYFRFQVATIFLYTVDVILVGMICGPKSATVYGVLARIFAIIQGFLQTTGEAAWPVVAQSGLNTKGFADPLIRFNAWAYGAVMGAAGPTLLPFCHWYVGESWSASSGILYLVMARYWITGLAVPAAFCLLGLAEMKTLTRYMQRELTVSLVLGTILGIKMGLPGIAWGFCLATVAGTLWPLPQAYAKAAGQHPMGLMGQMWWRTLTGFAASYGTAYYAVRYLASGWHAVVAGMAGVLAALAAAVLFTMARNAGGLAWPRSMKEVFQIVKMC